MEAKKICENKNATLLIVADEDKFNKFNKMHHEKKTLKGWVNKYLKKEYI
jgi:hypothetical protein